MLDSVTYLNADGVTSVSLNTATNPLKVFEPDISERVIIDRNKMQEHGAWPTYRYSGGMSIHMEGDLFGDDTPTYMTQRNALLAAIRGPNPGALPTTRKDGTLTIQIDGETEAWFVDVIVTAFTPGPIEALYPALTNYALTVFSFDPWFTGVTSGNFHWWG